MAHLVVLNASAAVLVSAFIYKELRDFLPHLGRPGGGETPRIFLAHGGPAAATNDRMMARCDGSVICARASSASPAGEYNSPNAPRYRDAAGGSVRPFADQPARVRVGCGFQASRVLQARRQAQLLDDGGPTGIVVGPNSAGCQMPFFSARSGDFARPIGKSAGSFSGDIWRTYKSPSVTLSD